MGFLNVYVVGKKTPNKLKLFQMLAGKEPDGKVSPENLEEKLEFTKKNGDKFTVMNLTEEEADSLKKDENAFMNYFYYVYDVDDRETFEKLEKIHQKLKEKFNNKNKDLFVLYGINSNIKNERKISIEELMTTAAKNKTYYFELQEFNMEKIHANIDGLYYSSFNLTVYVTGSEQSGYKEVLEEEIKKKFNNFEFLHKLFIPRKIEEMKPLEEIIEKSIKERKKLSINFIYSPYDRETFTSIEEYVSKCSSLQNYDELELFFYENKLIEGEGKEKEVTSLEVTQFCCKYKIDKTADFKYGSRPEKVPDGFIPFKNSSDFDFEKYGVKEDGYKYHINCNLTECGVVNFYECQNFYDIYFCRLLDNYIYSANEKGYNYIIACDSCGFRGSKLKKKRRRICFK